MLPTLEIACDARKIEISEDGLYRARPPDSFTSEVHKDRGAEDDDRTSTQDINNNVEANLTFTFEGNFCEEELLIVVGKGKLADYRMLQLSLYDRGIVVTNEGNVILWELDLAHLTTKSVGESSRTQSREVGGDASYVIVLSAKNLHVALAFTDAKVVQKAAGNYHRFGRKWHGVVLGRFGYLLPCVRSFPLDEKLLQGSSDAFDIIDLSVGQFIAVRALCSLPSRDKSAIINAEAVPSHVEIWSAYDVELEGHKVYVIDVVEVESAGILGGLSFDKERNKLEAFYKLISGDVIGLPKKPLILQEDTTNVLYSSRTTGTSKSVVQAHNNLFSMDGFMIRVIFLYMIRENR